MTGGRLLVDSNILLDVLTEDPQWLAWSSGQLSRLADSHLLLINPVVYAEVSIGFERIEEIEEALPADYFVRSQIPWEALFLAGKCLLKYRRAGGNKNRHCPIFPSAPMLRLKKSRSRPGTAIAIAPFSPNSSL